MLFKNSNHQTKALVYLIIMLFFNAMEAQDAPAIIPPSPEAASLGKFTEVPISHYTGLPNISVPITSYSLGGKSFPVSINYHARGLKVEEIASRVGIGWALNAGGQIIRQVRHHADDGPHGYVGDRLNPLMDALAADSDTNNFFTSQNARNSYAISAGAGPGHPEPDRHPDQFMLQAGTLSAKFIFDYKDDSPLIQNYDNILISYGIDSQLGKIDSFMVIDKDGFKYYFGVSKNKARIARNYEQNLGNYGIKNVGGYDLTYDESGYIPYSSWSLMDVESPSGELVSFVYENQTSVFFRRNYDIFEDNTNAVSHVSKIMSHQNQLKEIIHNGGRIEFESLDLRQDIGHFNESKELDRIKIYDGNQGLVKTFLLYQSYPNTVADANQNPALVQFDSTASKRLRLDSIVEIGRNGVAKPPFVFTYNSQQMPNRFSNSQDLWGYYNGKGNGHFLTYFGTGILGADRTVDTLKSLTGMLEKIKYPTGGSTKFTYEHNKGVLGPEFQYVNFPKVNSTKTVSTFITNIEYWSYTNGAYSKDFTMNNATNSVRVKVDLPTINGINYNDICSSPHNDCGFQIRLEPINNNPNPIIYFNSGIRDYTNIHNGDYRLIVEPKNWLFWDPEPMNVAPFIVSLTWKEEILTQTKLIYTSGKRIHKIEFFDSGNNLAFNKEYSYLDDFGRESGIILSLPFFGPVEPKFADANIFIFEPGAAFPGSLFTTYQDNTIGYGAVTEYYGDNAHNSGKIHYSFYLQRDTGDFLSYPITPPTDNEWLRGLPHIITYYNRNVNGMYAKVKSISNGYLYGNDFLNNNPNTPVLFPYIFTPLSKRYDFYQDLSVSEMDEVKYLKTNTFFRLPLINLYISSNPGGSATLYKVYHFTGGTLSDFKRIETLYDDDENPTLVTETKTEFNYEKHYQPSKVTTVGSDGIPVVQTFHYPKDITEGAIPYPIDESAALDTLISQNRLEVVRSETRRDGTLLSTVNNLYHNDSFALPKLVQTSKGTGILEDRIIYHSYYPDGNVKEVSRADGIKTTYIWGYNGQYPIAKIEGASFGDIPSGVYSSIVSASDSDVDGMGEDSLRGELAKLRSTDDCPGLSDALVTTYTYDPLVGMTSMTDVGGHTVYYGYDGFNRLEHVKDAAGNILNQNDYHYRDQP